MKSLTFRRTTRLALIAMVAAAALGPQGCGLDEVGDPGAITGPAARGVQLKLTATPDIVLANGVSTSVVQGRLLGPTGQPIAGRDVVFSVDAGSLNGGFSLVTARTDGSGVATVTYHAPSSLTVPGQAAQVVGRVIGSDANGSNTSIVGIDLIGNVAPVCDFTMDPTGPLYAEGDFVSFTSASSDPEGGRLRFHWFFGDGGEGEGPTAGHFYRTPGKFTVRHIVSDPDGGSTGCFKVIGVEAAPAPSPSPVTDPT